MILNIKDQTEDGDRTFKCLTIVGKEQGLQGTSHDIFLQFELTLAFSSLSFQLLVCMGVAERVGETGVALRVGETGVALRVGETGVAPA